MPTFTARITDGATQGVWTDARLNPAPAYQHTYRRVAIGATVTVKATVGGVEGEIDANLGGDLFTSHFAEVPTWPAPSITSPGGQSSVATFTVPLDVTSAVGHWTFVFRRANGGSILVPFYTYDSA